MEEEEEQRWKTPISGQQIAAKLHEPGCNPNAKRDERYSIYKTYSGLICGWSVPDSIIALMTWRGLLDMDQIVAVYRFGMINLNSPNPCVKNWNLVGLVGYLDDVDANNALVQRYIEIPNQVRKECRMKFSVCKEHDAAAIFVQILFLSNNYFAHQ